MSRTFIGSSPADGEEIEDPRAGLQRIIWSVETDERRAALSFDDGPHPALTPRILEILDRYGITATFMVMGHAAQQNPALISEIVAAGHEVGCHSWRHLNLATASVQETREEIEIGTRVVEDVAGVPVGMFRPPRGRLSEAAVRLVARLRQDIVLWSVTRGALDWRSPQRIASHVVNEVGAGDIIDFHDGIGRGLFHPGSDGEAELLDRRRSEIEALPLILEGVAAQGVQLGSVSELLAARARR